MIDLFTEDEVRRAKQLLQSGKGAKHLHEELVLDAMPRIDKTTGQTNNSMYMAYRLEYIAMNNTAEGA